MSKQGLSSNLEKSQIPPSSASNTTELDDGPATLPSRAAVLNGRIMARLQKKLAEDPEVDLLSFFPPRYHSRLAAGKAAKDGPQVDSQKREAPTTKEVPFSPPEVQLQIIHPLSNQVKTLLGIGSDVQQVLLEPLTQLIKNSDPIFNSPGNRNKYVVKCSDDIVVKHTALYEKFTEYETLQYLQEHRPTIPAPHPHGLIVSGRYQYIFMSFIPGVTLAKVWPNLSHSNKLFIQQSLNDIFSDLRQIPFPQGSPLGGVGGEGCKDTRRDTRISELIYTPEEFWDFQYPCARAGGRVYFEVLDRLARPYRANEVVFSHGDLRDENIILRECDGKYVVGGIIDWEMSGFYPADFECVKATNVFGMLDNSDWFLYLPPCISPETYPIRWLADRVWGPHVA